MKRLKATVLAAAVITTIVFVGAAAQTQGELEQDACKRCQRADAELNRVYKQILNEYGEDKRFIEKLKLAQRAWVAFRDAHIESICPEPDARMAYGSVNPMCRCLLLTDLTTQRTKALRQWIDGVKEGDVCSGSIRVKR